ncbi:MAG: response regulator [Bacteroidota bacterium]|nr:response regulator [Bacteroidota bacterium]
MEKNNNDKKSDKSKADVSLNEPKLDASFLEFISTGIRGPINTILGFSNLLEVPKLDDLKRREYSNIIYNSCSGLLNLLDDFVEIIRIETDQIQLVKGECQINKIITELYISFNEKRKKLGLKYVELMLDKANVDDNLIIEGDRFRIRQILSYLLDNALKYTDIGTITFGYKYIGTGIIRFYVKDTGIGIDKDKIGFVFGKFNQIKHRQNNQNQGMGIGLYNARKLSETIGGKIWVESEPAKGSVFYFEFPMIRLNISKKQIIPTYIEDEHYNWKSKTILVAEDERLNFRLLQEVLSKTKVRIISVQDGKHAVDICLSNPRIDLVLMDIQMPIMDGYEATRKIKQTRPELPIIAQTAYARAGEKERSLEAGCDSYVSKPIDAKILLAKIDHYFSRDNK